MGQFQVQVRDLGTGKVTTFDGDGLWDPRISVWSDNQITSDNDPGCTGRCEITVKTKSIVYPLKHRGNERREKKRRGKSKVKVLTLSVRKCIEGAKEVRFII
jgi:hypothetical protein